jgi:surface antigen
MKRPILPRWRSFLLVLIFAIGTIMTVASPAQADSTLCTGNSYSTCTNAGYTDHGYAANSGTSYWTMYQGHNCTNYAAYMASQNGAPTPSHNLGSALDWDTQAQASGIPVNGTPAVGAIAQWEPNAGYAGYSGHVAYVEAVTSNSITVSEDNYASGPFTWRTITIGSVNWPSNFIHFGGTAGSSSSSRVYLVSPNDDKLYTNYRSSTGVWSGWQSMGGEWPVETDVTEGVNADGRRQVFLVGGDHKLYTAYQTSTNGGWSGWQSLGGAWSSSNIVAVDANADGRLQVFLVGQDGRLYSAHQNAANGSSWSGWYSLGGDWHEDASVAVSSNADGRMAVFIVGKNGKLYTARQNSPNGGWSGWQSLGGAWSVDVHIAVGPNANGKLQVFLVGGGNHPLYTAYQTTANSNSWSGWQNLSGAWSESGDVAVGSNANGRLQLFLVSPNDHKLYTNRQASANGSSWSGWQSLNGAWPVEDDIGLTRNTSSEIQVYLVSGNDQSLYVNRQTAPNGGWSGWQSLNGAWSTQSHIGAQS